MPARFSREELKKTAQTQGDFILASNYAVEIAGIAQNGITKVDGIKFTLEEIQYKHAEQNHKSTRPGLCVPGKLTLTRNYYGKSKEFQDWMNTSLSGKHDRRAVSVSFRNDAGVDVKKIDFFNCYATGYKPPNLSSLSSKSGTETLTIMFEDHKVMI